MTAEKNKGREMLQTSSQSSLTKIDIKKQRKEFLLKFNPDYQMKVCENTRNCFFGKFPTLAELSYYGENTAKVWLIIQLNNLSEYSGARSKLDEKQLEHCAFTIAKEYSYLKISEVMLFFHWFKSGRYEKFFGYVDPLAITKSLQTFINDRAEAIDKEREKKQDAYYAHISKLIKASKARRMKESQEEYKKFLASKVST